MSRAPKQENWSVYIHFPWCLKRCAYCDFATAVAAEIPRQQYLDGILRELQMRTVDLEPRPISTVFFGGGTPSLWGAQPIGAVLDWLDRWGGLQQGGEFTIEANPGALEHAPLADYVAVGINRISVGIQALDDRRLQRLDRLHDAATARASLAELQRLLGQGQLQSASADLLFGAPGQGMAELKSDLDGVLAYDLPHLSLYSLTVEEGTPLAKRVVKGLQSPPDDDLQADMLEQVPLWLAERGLHRYEVSNFARDQHQSRHNLCYWHGGHWLAAGVGAHGHLPGLRGDLRYGNHRDHRRWFAAIETGQLPEVFREDIDGPTLLTERILTELRLSEGIDLERLARDVGPVAAGKLRQRGLRLAAHAPLTVTARHLRLMPHAFAQLDHWVRQLAQ